MRAMRRTLGILIAAVLSTSQAAAQSADETVEALRSNGYAMAMLELLDQWNAGKIAFKKSAALLEFEKRLARYSLAPEDRPTVERWFSRELIEAEWKNLPEELTPELRLSPGAKLVLAAAVLDQSEQLQKLAQPSPDELQNALASSLFITLGAAQQEAREQGSETIDATTVRRAGVRFFSLGWPFCCASEPP